MGEKIDVIQQYMGVVRYLKRSSICYCEVGVVRSLKGSL